MSYGAALLGRTDLADDKTSVDTVALATELTIAWLGNPNTRAASEDVPAFLNRMHQAVASLSSPVAQGDEQAAQDEPAYTPATTVRRSLASADHIISMIDGKPYRTLRRHLSKNGLTPEQYRERYKLKPDYPMVAPSYSEVRRSMAQRIGLGQKGRSTKEAGSGEATPAKAPARRGRPRKEPKSE